MRFLESRETAYNLRDSENKFNIPLHVNYYKNDFNYSGAILWKSQLPVTQGKHGPWGSLNGYLKEMSWHGIRGKQLFC